MPDQASEKPKALPKGPVTTSAFINKGGKTFAPKVVRRRPGAATASAPKPASAPPSAPKPAPDNVSADATPAPDPRPAAQLPTPAATLEAASQKAPVAESSAAVPATVAPPSDTGLAESVQKLASENPSDGDLSQRNSDAKSSATPAPDPFVEKVTTSNNGPSSAPETVETVENTQPAGGKSPSTLPIESGPVKRVVLTTESTPTPPADEATNTTHQPSQDAASSQVNDVDGEPAQEEREGEAQTTQAPASHVDAAPTQSKRRRLPWTAVNASQEDTEAGPSTVAPRAKPRRKRKAITLREMDEEDEQDEAEEERRKRPKRASARAHGKRPAQEPGEDDDEDIPAPPKKTRKPRKDKGKKRAAPEGHGNEGGEAVEGEASRMKKRRKKQSTTQAEGQTDRAEGEQQPKRRGRPPREPTPSDAEDEVIDPGQTLMTSLASHNIRVGKLSEREKKMRTINWDEVKQRRREQELSRNAQQTQAEMERRRQALDEAATPEPDANRPQYRIVGGEMVLAPTTNAVNPEADAQREMDNMEVIDEDELTNPINHKSFLRNNKRFPSEFLLPGQGKRWSDEDTNRFWMGIEMFGTDFAMIATLFPGVSRTSIKNKFLREERAREQFLKQKLHGPVNSDWEFYLQESKRQEDSFADVDRIQRELAEAQAEHELEVQKAKAEREEELRQMKLAGLDNEDEAAGGRENTKGKGKKGKDKEKQPEKQVAFVLRDDEELVGSISDDETWGRV